MRLAPVLLVAVLLAACGQTRPATSDSADEARIRSLLEGSASAWNRGDLDGHVAMNADSVWFMTGRGPIIGRATSRASLERSFFREGRPLQQLRYERVSVRMLGADHAVVVGRFILTGGDRADTTGWFTTVWERQPRGWQIIHDHSS